MAVSHIAGIARDTSLILNQFPLTKTVVIFGHLCSLRGTHSHNQINTFFFTVFLYEGVRENYGGAEETVIF